MIGPGGGTRRPLRPDDVKAVARALQVSEPELLAWGLEKQAEERYGALRFRVMANVEGVLPVAPKHSNTRAVGVEKPPLTCDDGVVRAGPGSVGALTGPLAPVTPVSRHEPKESTDV